MNSVNNAYSNPEYMSFEELIHFINQYKLEKFENYFSLPLAPPNKRPPSPPKTPPPILTKPHRHKKIPLYQNVTINNSDSSWPNGTMIVHNDSELREQHRQDCLYSPPKPLMTSSRLNLFNSFHYQKQVSKSTKTLKIHKKFVNHSSPNKIEDFYSLQEEGLEEPSPQKEKYCYCLNNPNYYLLNDKKAQNSELESPEQSVIYIPEPVQPPSPFKSDPVKLLDAFTTADTVSLSPSKHCLLTSSQIISDKQNENDEFESVQERAITTKLFTNEDYLFSNESSSETYSTTSTSGYKSNQSNSSVLSFANNSEVNKNHNLELNYFIEINKQRLDRLKYKRMRLNNTSSLSSQLIQTSDICN